MDETSSVAAVATHSNESTGRSPLETFILEDLESRRDELNTFSAAKSHIKLLLDAARRHKLRAQKIGWTSTSTFALYRSGAPVGGIYGRVTTLVSHQAQRTAASRELTRQCLVLSEVPHLPGKTLHVTQAKAAASFVERMGRPVSVRPAARSTRAGISSNVSTAENLTEAWDQAASACAKLPVIKQQIDVETYLPWVPLRVFVVGEQAVAAVARVPLYVVGDGSRTLGQLTEAELPRRSAPAFLDPLKGVSAARLLKAQQLDADTVPPPGGLQLLTNDPQGQLGLGWSVDVLDQVSDSLVQLAVNAMWAFAGLGATAVDILTPALDSAENAVVSGVEPDADLREFRFPAFGKPQYPNRAIMDRIAASSPR